MLSVLRFGGIALVLVTSVLLLSAARAPGLLAQGNVSIEGRVTGVNTLSEPPTLSVVTDGGTGYIVRAPNVASIASAQIGSRFKATGTVTEGVFVAFAIEILPSGQQSGPPPKPQAVSQSESIVGIVTGLDTESSPPRVLLDTGAGVSLLVVLPGPGRVADLQIGETISVTGRNQGGQFQATSFAVLSRPSSGDDEDNDNHGGGDDNNENADDGNDNGGDDGDTDNDNSDADADDNNENNDDGDGDDNNENS